MAASPAAVLYQRIVATASNPGPIVGGIEVDVNDVLDQDCGQWNLHRENGVRDAGPGSESR
jgi:hypothetical protein